MSEYSDHTTTNGHDEKEEREAAQEMSAFLHSYSEHCTCVNCKSDHFPFDILLLSLTVAAMIMRIADLQPQRMKLAQGSGGGALGPFVLLPLLSGLRFTLPPEAAPSLSSSLRPPPTPPFSLTGVSSNAILAH